MTVAGERRPLSRRRKVTIGTLLSLALLSLVLAFGGWWLISTRPGAKWGFERLSAYLPGELVVGSVEGPLRGPLLVRDLRYTTDRIHISMNRLALDWSLRGLARQRLDIRSFEADSVRIAIVVNRTPQAVKDTLAPELPDVDLPLDVLVGRGRVQGLFITPAGSDSAIRIDEVTLVRAAFRDTLEIGALDVRAPGGHLHVEGRARTLGRYGVDLQSRWSMRPRSGGEVRGGGRLVGTLDTLRLVQQVERPFQASVDVTLFTPMKDLDFRGSARVSGLDLTMLDPGYPAARVDGGVEAGGDFDVFTASGTLDTRTAELGRVHSTFTLTRRDSTFRFERLALSVPGRPARIVARGTLMTTVAGPRGDFSGSWQSLTWPLEVDRAVFSPRGTFRVTGSPDRYRLTAAGIVSHPSIPAAPWSARGNGTTGGITLTSIDGRPLGGRVSGTAAVTWGVAARWRAKLVAREIDPEAMIPGWDGRVAFGLAASGSASASRTELVFTDLEGTMRGAPVTGRAAVSLLPDGYSFPGVDLRWGANHLTASGELRSSWSLTWTLDAPDLTRVDAGAEGRLTGRGEFRGRGGDRRILGTLEGDSIRFRSFHVRQLHAVANLHPAADTSSNLVVTLHDARFPSRVVDHAELRLEGWIDRHVLKLSATGPQDSLRMAAAGGWRNPKWLGKLTVLDLLSRDFGTWALEREAALAAGPPRFTVDGFCWRSGPARWCADLDLAPNGAWTLATRLDDLELARFEPLLPPGLALSGPLDLTADLEGMRGQWTGSILARAGPGAMGYGRAGGGAAGHTPIDSAVIAVAANRRGLAGRTAIALGPAGTIDGALQAPRFAASGRLEEGPMSGRLRVRLTDLGFVQGFLPDFTNLRGTMESDLQLAGEVRRPRWSGSTRLAGEADVPRLGLELREIRLVADADAAGRLRFEGGARSAPGQLTLDGELGINPEAQFHATAAMTGDRFRVMNTRESKVLVSPRLQLAVNGDSIGITGELAVPQAEIREQPRRRETVGPSSDVVFVSSDSTRTHRPRRPLHVDAEVRLVLGNDVRVRAYGLEARATGSVLAIERPNAPTSGSGELRLTEGTYRAYGQRLKIERGRLIFAGGPIANPGLDVRAVRTARDGVTAGFEVKGTLETPRFSVFSDPVMAQRDALAYVMFGKRIDRGNQNEEDIVTDAANVLGVGGGSYITETLARKFGIDEASIESQGAFEEASLMLGTYLSPRLYVNYGIGLLDPGSTLRLQYFLNNRWTLQAETGSENSAEILYTVERR